MTLCFVHRFHAGFKKIVIISGMLLFAYVYRKRGKKINRCIAYWGKNEKLYRYITSEGNVHDFKDGIRSDDEKIPVLYREMSSKGRYWYMLANESSS